MATLTKGLAQEYSLLYESCLIRPNRKAAIAYVVRRLKANQARYAKVARALKMPWYVVAVIHQMEAGGDFTRHLHNGDPLTARTRHVPPAGRKRASRRSRGRRARSTRSPARASARGRTGASRAPSTSSRATTGGVIATTTPR